MADAGSKSKKRSGASYSSKPLEPLVFFLDRSLGKKIIATSLRRAGAEVRIHEEHFRPDANDEDWLEEAGESGWIVLTKDRRIRYRTPELAAVKRARVRLFTLTAGDLQGPEMAAIFVKALPAIQRIAARHAPPFIAKVTKSGLVSVLLSSAELRRRRW